jgi:hypothetical protein
VLVERTGDCKLSVPVCWRTGTCMYVCVGVGVCVCVCIYIYIYIYICMSWCVGTRCASGRDWRHQASRACLLAQRCVYVCVCVCVYIYKYIYIHLHVFVSRYSLCKWQRLETSGFLFLFAGVEVRECVVRMYVCGHGCICVCMYEDFLFLVAGVQVRIFMYECYHSYLGCACVCVIVHV